MKSNISNADYVEEIQKFTVQQDFLNILNVAFDLEEVLNFFNEDHPMINITLNRLISQLNKSNTINLNLLDNLDHQSELWAVKQHCKSLLHLLMQQYQFQSQTEYYLQRYLTQNLTRRVVKTQEPYLQIQMIPKFNESEFGSLIEVEEHYPTISAGLRIPDLEFDELIELISQRQDQMRKYLLKNWNSNKISQSQPHSNLLNDSFINSSQQSQVTASLRSIQLIKENQENVQTFARQSSSKLGSPIRPQPETELGSKILHESTSLSQSLDRGYQRQENGQHDLDYSESESIKDDSYMECIKRKQDEIIQQLRISSSKQINSTSSVSEQKLDENYKKYKTLMIVQKQELPSSQLNCSTQVINKNIGQFSIKPPQHPQSIPGSARSEKKKKSQQYSFCRQQSEEWQDFDQLIERPIIQNATINTIKNTNNSLNNSNSNNNNTNTNTNISNNNNNHNINNNNNNNNSNNKKMKQQYFKNTVIPQVIDDNNGQNKIFILLIVLILIVYFAKYIVMQFINEE